jgi:hypothetical protein
MLSGLQADPPEYDVLGPMIMEDRRMFRRSWKIVLGVLNSQEFIFNH